ncbi:peroxide stress protein YaaA [Chryseobacterium sp. MEBOG06]|uniref:peroxide stress protein YaaA n=1 Tax=unclassified Chryseobacterium TaxID=2593645 RepID=UPI001F438AD6|nr:MULTISPECIES: peroxide stress protein YaaA [unclassified Chryseobacterium]UKB81951.1 peroxide stress protein YaaA [Chryseobacterium sp. MEBOG06]
MKIITSPAKLMNVENTTDLLKPTTPKFIEEAAFIQTYLKEKSPKYLSELMEISAKLADENWERNQRWKSKPTAKESTPAMFAFTGEVYRGLDAKTLNKEAVDYLQKNYRMLSGLYGLLKPSDKVMLYRLEMGRPFKFDTYKNLYEFWREKITEQLNSEMKKGEVLLHLASNEYGKVIDRKKLNHTVIDFDFYELKEGKLKTIVVYTKHARGLVVRFCAETNAQTLDDVKAFNYEGYRIDDEKSTDTKLVFTR